MKYWPSQRWSCVSPSADRSSVAEAWQSDEQALTLRKMEKNRNKYLQSCSLKIEKKRFGRRTDGTDNVPHLLVAAHWIGGLVVEKQPSPHSHALRGFTLMDKYHK